MFNVGDWVKVIDEDVEGKIIRVFPNRITLENQFGFEESYPKKQLILKQKLIVETVDLNEAESQSIQSKITLNKQKIVKEIDLHFGQLIDFPKGVTNHEILRIQLDTVKNEIALARQEKRTTLIFIHGHGKGVLKNELHKLLKNYPKLEFYDASFKKYKLGATQVELF